MLNKKKCLVGNDSSDTLIGILIVVMVFIVIISYVINLIVFIGAVIGGGHALRNYYLAFKHNIIDNRDNSDQTD